MSNAWSRPPAVLLRHAIDSHADGFVVADLDGRPMLANTGAATGATPSFDRGRAQASSQGEPR